MSLELRKYQSEAIDSVFHVWKTGQSKNPLIVAPTGAGKTIIISGLIKKCLDISGDVRILIVTHSQELIQQNHDELVKFYPETAPGVYSSGLKRKETKNNILFAGIQSIYKVIHKFDPFDIVIIDEAHTIPKKSETMYGTLLKTLHLMNPKIKCIGLTATPYRLDSGRLFGPGCLFDSISYEIKISELIKLGYLCPVISRGGVDKIDLSGVKKRGREYVEKDLSKAAMRDELTESVVKEIVEYGKHRKAWLVFASGIEHAKKLMEEFKKYSVNPVLITGKTKKSEREKIVSDFRDGKTKCLINIGVLTTGFNAPICDLIAMVRATLSTALYVQIVGRGMRIAPGKENCLFLDYGHNVVEHGPVDAIEIPRSKTESTQEITTESPQKECPECHSFCHAAKKECVECGYIFPENEVTHAKKAYSGAILSSQIKSKLLEVTKVEYKRHKKIGKPDMLEIMHWCGIDYYAEYICLEHFGVARDIARKKIKILGGKAKTVTESLKECDNYKVPKKIEVVKSGRYNEIKKKLFIVDE